ADEPRRLRRADGADDRPDGERDQPGTRGHAERPPQPRDQQVDIAITAPGDILEENAPVQIELHPSSSTGATALAGSVPVARTRPGGASPSHPHTRAGVRAN